MKLSLQRTIDQLKVLILSGLVILITQKAKMGVEMDIKYSIIGMLWIIIISIIAIKIKEMIPLNIPAFAWASLIALILSTPMCPISDTFLSFTNNISTGIIGTVILAVAGVSIGTRLDDMKELSWKIIIVAIVVFVGTFFGSALVSEFILKIQGII